MSTELPKGFLSDVMTAAGLVTHGKQCGALGERLSRDLMAIHSSSSERVALSDGWILAVDRLPEEWVEIDDSPCVLEGKPVGPMYTGVEVLVSLSGGGVRLDHLVQIGEDGKPWWSKYGERVTHWQPKPPSARGNDAATSQINQKNGDRALTVEFWMEQGHTLEQAQTEVAYRKVRSEVKQVFANPPGSPANPGSAPREDGHG